jgi:hypothetical protein
LGDSVLYCYLDSVIYIQKVDETPTVKTGDNLDDLTEGMEEFGSGSYIDEFVSVDPKNLAFSVFSLNGKGTAKCKLKGINLNYISKVLNFTALRNIENYTLLHVRNPRKIIRRHGGVFASGSDTKK